MSYSGKIFLAPSGQFGFKVYQDGEELSGGAGFESMPAAKAGCLEVLADHYGCSDAEILETKYEDLPALG